VIIFVNVPYLRFHNPSGKAALIIDLGSLKYWEVVSCSFAMDEARRNIIIKFPRSVERLDSLLTTVKKVPSGSGRMCPIPLPPKDRPILEAATRCKATHLLTGGIKDFGPFMNNPDQAAGVIIQTVSEFLTNL
jgi:uncharacterized protein